MSQVSLAFTARKIIDRLEKDCFIDELVARAKFINEALTAKRIDHASGHSQLAVDYWKAHRAFNATLNALGVMRENTRNITEIKNPAGLDVLGLPTLAMKQSAYGMLEAIITVTDPKGEFECGEQYVWAKKELADLERSLPRAEQPQPLYDPASRPVRLGLRLVGGMDLKAAND